MNAGSTKNRMSLVSARSTVLRGLLIALFFASPAVALASFAEEWSGNAGLLTAAASAAGIISYVYLLNLFIIGTRPQPLLRLFSKTGLLRFHVAVSLISVLLAAVHGMVKATTMAPVAPQLQSGLPALIALAGAGAVGVSALAAPVARGVETLGRHAAESRVWARVSNITGAAVLLALFHVLYASTTLAADIRTLIMGGWFVFAVGAYAHHLRTQSRRRARPARRAALNSV